MNKILGQYFLKELAVTWFSVTFILLVVLATNKFADVIGDIASGDLPPASLVQIILYSSIDYLVVLIPLSTFLSILIVLGRFYKEQEMTAILSSIIIGVGVDFSIHYTSEYKRLIEEKKSNKTITTIANVGHPILLDALSNMGFASLMLSTIIPMTQIGGLMVFAMCACSLGTLTLLASSIEIFKHKL